MTAPILSTKNVRVNFGGVRAADGVNLDINKGEFTAIVGPNGSGKTTFLNLCTGYVHPTTGRIYLGERDITGLGPRAITQLGIARSFQIPQLFTDHSLLENVLFSVAARQSFWSMIEPLDRRNYSDTAKELIALVGLTEMAGRSASVLPEGMRKLADIALALALRPKLLLLDEPTAGVSGSEKVPLMDTLTAALRAQSVTAVFVEHDMGLVRRYADRVVVWDQGRVVADGKPDTVLTDAKVMQNVVGIE